MGALTPTSRSPGNGGCLAGIGRAEQHLRRIARVHPSIRSEIAFGWSPAGWYSDTIRSGLPASGYSCRAGLCGTKLPEVSGSSRSRPMMSSAMGGGGGRRGGALDLQIKISYEPWLRHQKVALMLLPLKEYNRDNN